MKNIEFLKSNLIAHRGVHNSEIPENTLPAFAKCVDKKYIIGIIKIIVVSMIIIVIEILSLNIYERAYSFDLPAMYYAYLLLHEAPAIFKKPGRTIRLWFEPIIRMWRFTKSNGITKGFHRKMKLIQRRAYGYRNFQNYRLRVLIECGHIVI